jgi:hypothetical protein
LHQCVCGRVGWGGVGGTIYVIGDGEVKSLGTLLINNLIKIERH